MNEVTVDVHGAISGGTFSSKMNVRNRNQITGGTFNGIVWNYATISGGTFKGYIGNLAEGCVIRGKSAGGLKIDCGIGYYDFSAQIYQPCAFGPNASIVPADVEGTIEVAMTVDGVETVVNYGADILKTLGASSTGLWYRVNADGTRSLVKEGEAFASLQGETYTSSPLLPKPEIKINYINEDVIVTLAEEDVLEGLDATDININFRQPGQNEVLFTGMASLPIGLSLSEFDRHWDLKLPSDKEITMEAYYSFVVTTDDGSVNRVYGETVEWVVPARPDINVNAVQPGYNEMTVTLDAEPYEVYLESVDGSTVIYDADDGVVDGCIHGLTEGTEYSAHFRVPPTEDSFASLPYLLDETFTTLTRTRLSVEAAETSWSWRPGFSLNEADCFTAQIATEGEVKELPEKGKFTLSAVNEYGAPVSFPLTNAGTYTVTASLAEDVANDYTLENGGVFTVTIDPVELPAPVLTLDYGAEIIAIAELPETLPEGIEWESLWIDIFANDAGIAKLPPVLTVGSWFTLSDLGYWYGETLPAAAGKEDAVLSFCFSIEGYEGNIVGQAAELVIPARPEADAPDSDARVNAVTWNSIQMLDADMLAEYDFGVAPRGDELPAEPAFVDADGDGLITGLAEDTECCLYFRKKATDGAFRSAWFSSTDVSARTNKSIPLAAGAETAEYAWTPDFALDIEEAIVFARVEGGGEQAIPENAFALTITDENGAAVEGTIRDAGAYTVNVALNCDNYVLAAGGDSFTITVRPLDLSGEEVVLSVEEPLTVGYTGASVYPQIGGDVLKVKVSVVDRGALPADCFTIEAAEGRNDINAGAAYLTIVGQGNATGRAELAYTIAAKDIADASVNVKPIGELVYTGAALEPPVTVKDGEKALVEGTDYTVTYADNTAVGTATVTITGMGNYTGTLTATFAIREAEKEDEDEADESTTEALTPAQQAEALAAGEAVDGTVTDRHGEAAGYVPSTEEVTDKETQEVLERTLVIAADPLLDEDGQPILRDGAPVYEQRNLNLSRGLLDALAELGYTHIRFVLGDAALEWQIAEMTEESYVVRLAPMEADELSQAEKEAIGAAETLTGSYRARVTAMLEGEEVDVTNALPSLTAIFDAASVRELAEGEPAQLLLVPNDGEPEAQVSTVQYIEATDTEPARYEAPLAESGLFALTLQ